MIRKSLVLITVDCLRADRLTERTMPFVHELSKRSYSFSNAFVAGMPTYYSFPAILAGRYPLAFGRDVVGLAPGERTLATVLKDDGYKTAAFIAGNPYLSRNFRYDQGFSTFDDSLSPSDLQEFENPQKNGEHVDRKTRWNRSLERLCSRWSATRAIYNESYFHYSNFVVGRRSNDLLGTMRKYPPADVVIDKAINWLAGSGSEDFFLWVHLMDPHHPYYPPLSAISELNGRITPRRALYLNSMWNRSDLDGRRLGPYKAQVATLYDAGVRWADKQIAKLLNVVKRDHTIVVVTSDHGEEFLEHGDRYHRPLKLTDELIRVPLMISVPGQKGVTVGAPFSLLDLMPSLLQGLELPSSVDARSRWVEIQAGGSSAKPVVTETVFNCINPWHLPGRFGPRLLSLHNGRHKLIVNFEKRLAQLFDLEADPCEEKELTERESPTVRRMLLEIARDHIHQSRTSLDSSFRFRARISDARHQLTAIAHSR